MSGIRILTLSFLSFCFFLSYSADNEVYYYASNHRPVENIQEAKFMKRVEVKGGRKQIVKSFVKNEKAWELAETMIIKNLSDDHQLVRIKKSLLFSTRIHRFISITPDGLFEFEEQIKREKIRTGTASSLVPLHLEGEIREYFQNGQLKTIALYENNQLLENENWLKNGTKYFNNIFYSVDKEPEYLLGFGKFRDHIMSGIKESGYDISQVDDKIIIAWVILEDGTLAGTHKVDGNSDILPNLIIKLVNTLPGDWSPASLNGNTVRYYMSIPFNFIHRTRYLDNLELNNGFLIWD